MEEDKCGGGNGDYSRNSPSFVKSGDRQIFSMELRPGETTIVSWKKLVKDVKIVSAPTHAPEPPIIALPAFEPRIIGDEYFEVDNSAIRHKGFFVNRGELERLNEPLTISNQQPKKRSRKDMGKNHAENDNCGPLNKQVKVGKIASGKSERLATKNFSTPSQSMGASQEFFEDLKLQSQLNHSELQPRRKSDDAKWVVDPPLSVKISNGSCSTSLAEIKDIDQQKTGIFISKNLSNKLNESPRLSDGSHQKFHERSGCVSSKPQSGRSLNNFEELESSKLETTTQPKEKNGIRELPDMNLPEVSYPSSGKITKLSNMHKKDGSSVRPRGFMLEKAIRELEKMVADSRSPAMDNQEAEAIKRRLPREIKLKLAEVARPAASHGKT